MKRPGQIASLLIALVPPLFLLYFRVGGAAVSISDGIMLAVQYVPAAAGLLLIALSIRIHRAVDILPAMVFLAYYLARVMRFGGTDAYSVVPEIALPTVILLTQIIRALPYRRWLEITGYMLTFCAITAAALPMLVSAIPGIADPDVFSLTRSIQTPWGISDAAVFLFILVAAVLAILPRDNPLAFRFEYILALIPAFLFFEDLASARMFSGGLGNAISMAGGNTSESLFRAVCALSFFLILILGVGRVYLRHAFVDELTELQNRRALDERIKRLGGAFALAMVDIDHFKDFNDTYGHSEGDNALRWTAKQLGDVSGRRAYRYGGEEFCVVFPARCAKDAVDEMETFRKGLEESKFHIRKLPRAKPGNSGRAKRGAPPPHTQVSVTVSIGVATRNDRRKSAEKVLKAADKALYEAKSQGRNRTCSAK
jgi:diguanylate cyclase (GGDEF)-like protein